MGKRKNEQPSKPNAETASQPEISFEIADPDSLSPEMLCLVLTQDFREAIKRSTPELHAVDE